MLFQFVHIIRLSHCLSILTDDLKYTFFFIKTMVSYITYNSPYKSDFVFFPISAIVRNEREKLKFCKGVFFPRLMTC